MNDIPTVCARLLNLYGEASGSVAQDIETVNVARSQRFAKAHVYRFTYKDVMYYASNDYSLNDDPTLVEVVLRDNNYTLEGYLVRNPMPQSDGAIYSLGLDGTEYCLWRCKRR